MNSERNSAQRMKKYSWGSPRMMTLGFLLGLTLASVLQPPHAKAAPSLLDQGIGEEDRMEFERLQRDLQRACTSERKGEFRATIASHVVESSKKLTSRLEKRILAIYEFLDNAKQNERTSQVQLKRRQRADALDRLSNAVDFLERAKHRQKEAGYIEARRLSVIEAKQKLDSIDAELVSLNFGGTPDLNANAPLSPEKQDQMKKAEALLDDYSKMGEKLDSIQANATGCLTTAEGTGKESFKYTSSEESRSNYGGGGSSGFSAPSAPAESVSVPVAPAGAAETGK